MRALQAPKEAGFDRPYRHMKPCRDFLITARLEKIEAEQLAAVLGSGVQHQARELSVDDRSLRVDRGLIRRPARVRGWPLLRPPVESLQAHEARDPLHVDPEIAGGVEPLESKALHHARQTLLHQVGPFSPQGPEAPRRQRGRYPPDRLLQRLGVVLQQSSGEALLGVGHVAAPALDRKSTRL